MILGFHTECTAHQTFAKLLEEECIKIPAWFAFNSKDGVHVVSGDSLLECATIAETCKKVVAVGINCTPPRFISDLIISIKKVQLLFFCLSVKDKEMVQKYMDLYLHAQPLNLCRLIMFCIVFIYN